MPPNARLVRLLRDGQAAVPAGFRHALRLPSARFAPLSAQFAAVSADNDKVILKM
jgi:hypothetical protein